MTMTPKFKEFWLKKCWEKQPCYDENDNEIEGEEFCFQVYLEPETEDHDPLSKESWKEIPIMKAMISELGSYDGHAYGLGYCCEGFFDSFEHMMEVVQKLSSAFGNKLEWKIYK